MTDHARWIAVVSYRSELGLIEVDHQFEEIENLHNLVERGPDWNAIEKIEVRLNPLRANYPGDTVEAASRR